MSESDNRRRPDDYRYTVEANGAEITPLAAIEAFVGATTVRVLNVSMGGMALLFEREPQAAVGDIFDISLSIRERPFAVQIEVKALRGLRMSCQFLSASRAFDGALREFLGPKFLGRSLRRSQSLSNRDDIRVLVSEAHQVESHLGQNQSGVFVWSNRDGELLKLVAVSHDLIFEWSRSQGLRTGRLAPGKSNGAESILDLSPKESDVSAIQWDRHADTTLVHYFADMLLAWLSPEVGPSFVEKLLSDDGTGVLRFPNLP